MKPTDPTPATGSTGAMLPRRTMVVCLVVSWAVLLVLRDPTPAFVFDAAQYWSGAQAVAQGTNVYDAGGLATRGVLTAYVYLPAHAAATLLGGSVAAGSWAVLVQNALLVSLLGAAVIPMLLRRVVTVGSLHVVASSALTTLLLSGFVPYPLMDLPAMVSVMLAVALLAERRWWTALVGGGLLGVAVNLRPAYAAPVALVLLVVLVARWRRAPFVVVGGAAVLGVQAAYGWAHTTVVSALPPMSKIVSAIQFQYSAYGVRYDTIPFTAQDPRLWHCSRPMAEAVAGQPPPATSGEMLSVLVHTLPQSALFAIDKVSAALHWSWAVPYATPGEQALRPLGLLVIAVSCAGLVALLALLRTGAIERMVPMALVALTLGVAATLVGASPEARFALPVVVGGIVGAVASLDRLRGPWSRQLVIAIGLAGILTVLVAALGWRALQHDVPRGDLTVEACLAT